MDAPKELNEIVLPQTVVGPLTRAAIFLVVCMPAEQDNSEDQDGPEKPDELDKIFGPDVTLPTSFSPPFQTVDHN